MEARLVALKLFLSELGIPANIETVDDRKRVQKAVYLGQLSHVDLGYRFGWYLMGPYSPPLTKDYYSLAEAIDAGDDTYENEELRSPYRERLRRVAPLLAPPGDLGLSQEDWLELVSSYHYLRTISRYGKDKAVEVLQEKKPHLVEFTEEAEKSLEEFGLLQNS